MSISVRPGSFWISFDIWAIGFPRLCRTKMKGMPYRTKFQRTKVLKIWTRAEIFFGRKFLSAKILLVIYENLSWETSIHHFSPNQIFRLVNKKKILPRRSMYENSRIYTEDYLVVATTITSARLLSSQCKHGEIGRLLSSRARLSSRRYSRQNVSSDGHLRYLRKFSDQCKFGRLL